MGLLTYSNENQINIIPQNEFESLVREVFNVIASNITKSLGPLGSSATILDGMNTEATKDGYSILMKYRFNNRFKNMIYNLICAPCTKMNNTVGDGTTTAIALTNAIFNTYEQMKPKIDPLYRLPRQFTEAWDWVINDIIEKVKTMAQPIDPTDYDTIYHIAYVTSNGNHEISDSIAKIYHSDHTPSIKQKDSPTNKSYIQQINGFEFPTNLISDAFVKNEDGSTTLKNVATLLFDFKVDSDTFRIITSINEVMRAKNKKLIVIAPAYDTHMCDTVANQYINREYNSYNGEINLILTQYTYGMLKKNQVGDLAVILKSKVINEDLAHTMMEELNEYSPDALVEATEDDQSCIYRFIGSAEEVILSTQSSAIFHVDSVVDDKVYQDTLAAARRDLDNIIANTSAEKQSYAAKIYDARTRVLQLEMKNYIYYIGADSALQKQIIWDSVEDVIKCLRSATQYGVVPGCQLSIIKATLMQDNEELDDLKHIFSKIIRESVAQVYLRVLHGANGDGMVKLVPNWNLVSSEHTQEIIDQAVEKGKEIIHESIIKNQVFDMDKLEFSSDIITSAQTDIMVLSAASELVKILISSNQCIYLDRELSEDSSSTDVTPV